MIEILVWTVAISASFTCLYLADRLNKTQKDMKNILNQTPPQAGGIWYDLEKPLSEWEG